MNIRNFILFLLIASSQLIFAQKPKQMNAGEIKQGLKKLNVFGTVLYLAAHPDDENTRLIGFYANEKLYNTSYLSCTRGDGGQNLVGPEIRELLGIIRTQELLAARRTDGGNQYFTRANDFGYSKTADETLEIWNKDEVLSDIVWTIRKLRPDVIVTRFPPDERAGHGHHTASALLGIEAFGLTADESKYADQLDYVNTWQPKRIVFNTHPFFFSRRGQPFDTTEYTSIEAGSYNALLGKSYGEISALSRTQHKSQGFGSTGTRGAHDEWFKLLAGDEFASDPFEGVTTDHTRVKGGKEFAGHAENAYLNFDPEKPWVIVDDLIAAKKSLSNFKDDHWKEIKAKELDRLIKAVTGLYLEVKANDYSYSPGDSISLSVEIINRSPVDIQLDQLHYGKLGGANKLNQKLSFNKPFNTDRATIVPNDQPISQPYWLINESTLGMYNVKDQLLRGLPENEAALSVEATLLIGGEYFDYQLPIIFKRNDPVDGESYRPLEISPPAMVNIDEKVYVFASNEPREVNVKVKSGRSDINGTVSLDLPGGWRLEPSEKEFDLKVKGAELSVSFMVYPPENQSTATISAVLEIDGMSYNKSLVSIQYDHIPTQTLYPVSSTKLVKINIEKRGQRIGYIPGAGDEIPASLKQIGYSVVELGDQDMEGSKLAEFDAVIMGVRAYNTVDRLKFHQEKLLKYVEDGGTLIIQYNTSRRLVTKELGPYPLKLGRDRVSVEEAEIRVLEPQHQVMNFPNKITSADFENWVQERGLYFPQEWDDQYKAILSSNDPGEDPKDGGLLVAKYGEGYYIYSGYSWFRQLPAGVPGAYRLFTNLISIGKESDAGASSGEEE